MAKYYYLVASLPDLSLEKKHSKLNPDEIYENIVQNLEEQDHKFLRLFLLQNDLRNLVNLFSGNYRFSKPYPDFFTPSNFSEEQINELHYHLDEMPSFIVRLLEEKEDEFRSLDPGRIELLFFNAYYQQCLQSENNYIKRYFEFDLGLRNIIAGLNCKKYNQKLADHILDDYATSKAILKSNAKDFGLSDYFPYITKIQELIDAGDVIKLENFVEELRWNYIEEITSASFFDIDIILGYTTKLLMIKRKTQFRPEEGSERVISLMTETMKKLEIPVG
jgi:hypothetical protein